MNIRARIERKQKGPTTAVSLLEIYIERIFSVNTGLTLHKYIQGRRLTHAALRLSIASDRIIFLGEEVSDTSAGLVTAQLLHLEGKEAVDLRRSILGGRRWNQAAKRILQNAFRGGESLVRLIFCCLSS